MNISSLKTQLVASAFALSLIVPTGAWAKQSSTAPRDGDLELARKLESAFEKVAEQASESVVVITCTKKAMARFESNDEDEDLPKQFEGTPFEYFFRQRRFRVPEPRDTDSQGSGIIIRYDGFILTNNHVVDGADEIKVRLQDGREFTKAELVGVDSRTDVAVIKVDAKDLPTAQFGDSDKVRVGQWAIAIGSPFELEYSFTVGFISAKGRPPMDARTVATIDYFQTDASINPGNSGGPLCDIEGRVIGVNTLIRGLNRGIGFAIPINMAMDSAEKLIKYGSVIRPWIGISIEPLADNKELLDDNAKGLTEGVVVREIHPNTPAASSDLKAADIIVAVDGAPVKSPRDLQREILRKSVGQKVTLEVIRNGKPVKVPVQTKEMPDELRVASRRRRGNPRARPRSG